MMDFKTLLLKHQALLAENQALKEENLALKARLDLAESPESQSSQEGVQQNASRPDPLFHLKDRANPTDKDPTLHVPVQGAGRPVCEKMGEQGRQGRIRACLPE
jgi:hypothetical protein